MDQEPNKPQSSPPKPPAASPSIFPSRMVVGLVLGVFVIALSVTLFLVHLSLSRQQPGESSGDMQASNGRITADEQGGAGAPSAAAGAAPGMPVDVMAKLQGLKAAVEKNPNDPTALYELANMYYDAAKFDQAAPLYRRVIAHHPAHLDARVDLATCLFQTGQSAPALAILDSVLAVDPRHSNALFNVGVVKHQGGDDAGARTAWNRYLELYPDSPNAATVRQVLGTIAGGAGSGSKPYPK